MSPPLQGAVETRSHFLFREAFDADALDAGRGAGDDLHLGPRHVESYCEEAAKGLVGAALNGRGAEADAEELSLATASRLRRLPAGELVAGGAGCDTDANRYRFRHEVMIA